MIVGGILTFLMSLLRPAVELLPDLSLGVALNSRGAETFLDWVRLAGYMLPFETVFDIFALLVALQVFRIVVSFFKSLWGVLPIA